MKKQIEVVGAVIVRDGLVLCARRGPHGHLAGLWEFPGGKVERGETPHDALRREIVEELSCHIAVGREVTTTTHEYEALIVVLTTYWCTPESGDPVATEHAELRWVPMGEVAQLDWAPADIEAVEIVRAAAGAGLPRTT